MHKEGLTTQVILEKGKPSKMSITSQQKGKDALKEWLINQLKNTHPLRTTKN